MYNNSKKIIITLIIIIVILALAVIGAITYILINASENNSNNKVLPDANKIPETTNSMTIQTFNAQFTSYEGSDKKASEINSLAMVVNSNNDVNERKVTLIWKDLLSLDTLNNADIYEVEMTEDEEGYIDEITISKQETQNNQNQNPFTNNGNENPIGNGENQNLIGNGQSQIPINNNENQNNMEVLLFNSKFNSYLGNITGEKLGSLLQVCQESVNTNPEHKIQVTSENVSSLSDIVATDTYTVTFSYDANGYINKINFDKKI